MLECMKMYEISDSPDMWLTLTLINLSMHLGQILVLFLREISNKESKGLYETNI